MADEKARKLTRVEWAREDARRECATYGQDWELIRDARGVPARLVCSRPCGAPSCRVVSTPDAKPPTAALHSGRQPCLTLCDDDCEAVCHEWHLPSFKRDHDPQECERRQAFPTVEREQ